MSNKCWSPHVTQDAAVHLRRTQPTTYRRGAVVLSVVLQLSYATLPTPGPHSIYLGSYWLTVTKESVMVAANTVQISYGLLSMGSLQGEPGFLPARWKPAKSVF